MEDQNTRGTGRTTRLVKATPSGGFYVVSTPSMSYHIKSYLEHLGRPHDDLMIVSADDRNWYRGRKIDVLAIDHVCYSDVLRDHSFYPTLERAGVILYNDADGDVIVSTREARDHARAK